ncbi:MAG: DNA replication and repair protein RecF [Patescibacteria group bacterium]
MHLELTNWRRFEAEKFNLPETSLAICDNNGAGKTSILSGIYSLYTTQPWPDQNLKQCIRHEQSFFGLKNELIYFVGQLEPSGRLKTKQEFSTVEIPELPLILVYTPLENQLLHLSRSKKLDFLDQILSQLHAEYLPKLRKLTKVVQSKQVLIKRQNEEGLAVDPVLLETLNQHLWDLTTYFWKVRLDFLNFWKENLGQLNQWLNLTLHDFDLKYLVTQDSFIKTTLLNETDLGNYPGQSLFGHIWNRELAANRVLWGSQRDDFEILLNGEPITEILSRGEMRLLVLWLKYLGLRYSREKLHLQRKVWWFLDDAFNELDSKREEILIDNILSQVDWYVITTTKSQKICPNYELERLRIL